jgi:hypothetical protein
MRSATIRAALLTVGMLVTVATVADGGALMAEEPPQLASALAKAPETGYASTGQLGARTAAPGAPAGAQGELEAPRALPEHALSTLAALLIGIIGLLWVRRHTAEL